VNGATYTTKCSSDTTNSTCVPSFYARLDSPETSTYPSTIYKANYSFSKPAYIVRGDMTYEYAAATNATGTTIYPDGTQITKIIYTMDYAGYDVNVTYDNSTGTNYKQDFSHVQAAFNKKVVYFMVRTKDAVFRVSGMPSSDQVTARDYLTQFKILSSSQTTTGFCNGDSAAANNLTWTSNDLTKALDTPNYNALLLNTGWNSTGGQILNGPASCYAGTSTYTTRRNPTRTTSDIVCRNNNVSVEVAHAACVGALQGLEGNDNRMLDSCVYDWCSFGAMGDVTESYIIQATILNDLDTKFLTAELTAQPVTVDTQHRMIQNFILSSAITWDDTTELVWEFAYGGLVNVTVTINVTGMVYYNYKTGCRVQMTFKTVPDRRAALSVVQAETSTAPGVTAIGLDTATGAASMASAVNSVKKSNSHYSGVASVSASNFQSVGQAYTYTGTFAGGSFAPSAAPEDHDSELDEYLIIVGVVGAAVLIAIIVLIAVKMSARPTPAKADVETGHVGVTSVPLEPTPKEGK